MTTEELAIDCHRPFEILTHQVSETRQLNLNGPLVRLGTAGDVLGADSSSRSIRLAIETEKVEAEWVLRASEAVGIHALEVKSFVAGIRKGIRLNISKTVVWPRDVRHASFDAFRETLRNTIYVGATRNGTSEVFPVPDSTAVHGDVGVSGEYAPWLYVQHVDDEVPKVRRYPGESGVTFRRQLDAYLAALFPGGQANAEFLPRTQLTRLGFRSSTRSDWRRPINTGFGLCE